jgi:small subunit ribosomal protein S3
MGQKVNPIGLRVGITRGWSSKWYADRNYRELLLEDLRIREFVKGKRAIHVSGVLDGRVREIRRSLTNAAVADVEIERSMDRRGSKISLTLRSAKPGIIIGRGGKGVEDLRQVLQQMTGKDVQVAVNEIRQPELNAQLVAENIASQITKRIAYKRAMRQAIQRSMRIGARGIKVACAGRLAGSEMARRERVVEGKVPLHTLRADIDYGFAEAPTTYGNVGIKVWIYRGDIFKGEAPREWDRPADRSYDGEGRGERQGRGERRGRDASRGRGGRGDRGDRRRSA